jgi:hypothetical protein
MAKKVFTSKFFKDLFYEVLDEMWIDDDTYVMVFQDMVDKDGDTFHLEVEYHKDEDRVTFTRVYEHENVNADYLVTAGFKKDIEEYILKQVGVVKGMLTKQKIAVELTLDIDPSMSIGELNEWLNELTIEVKSPRATLAKPIKIENLGWTNNK